MAQRNTPNATKHFALRTTPSSFLIRYACISCVSSVLPDDLDPPVPELASPPELVEDASFIVSTSFVECFYDGSISEIRKPVPLSINMRGWSECEK